MARLQSDKFEGLQMHLDLVETHANDLVTLASHIIGPAKQDAMRLGAAILAEVAAIKQYAIALRSPSGS
ncbi:MAG TPA: hypothetical protein VFA76_16360 [Terriglobales bacterium]|nr:hypothetical protein [Terriglobales bacterium]